jgi:trigger factor
MPPATAETTAPAAANDVKIEDAGPARKKLTITIPAQTIDDKLAESMSTLATQTVLPGFRKGKAPQKLLERRFGTNVRTETKNQLVASAYASAIEANKLKPVGEPEPGEEMKKLELEPGKPLTFSLEVEVVPTFELPPFDGIEIRKPLLEISNDLIEAELKRQQLMHGTASKIERDFAPGDRMIGYAVVSKDGDAEPFFRQDNVLIVMPGADDGGRGQVLGLIIDGLHDLLKGKGIGDTIAIQAVGPDAHEREDLRGAKLSITYEIRHAERIEPATPAVVADKYGLPGEEILREQIKLALEYRRDDEQAAAMREQAIDQLADMVEFELPRKLSTAQSARQLEQQRLELLSRGMMPEEVEGRLAELRTLSDEDARSGLKRFFLLQRLGEYFEIEVSEQEVNGRIASIAAQRNIRPERLRSELAQAGRLGEVARMVRDQKAADRVVQQAKQVEVTAEQWNEFFKSKQRDKQTVRRKKTSRKSAEAADETPRSKAAAESESTKKKTSKRK